MDQTDRVKSQTAHWGECRSGKPLAEPSSAGGSIGALKLQFLAVLSLAFSGSVVCLKRSDKRAVPERSVCVCGRLESRLDARQRSDLVGAAAAGAVGRRQYWSSSRRAMLGGSSRRNVSRAVEQR